MFESAAPRSGPDTGQSVSEQLENILLTNSPGNLILAQLCRQWKSINMTWGRSSEETARYFIPQCGEIFLAKNFWYYKGRRNHRQRWSIGWAQHSWQTWPGLYQNTIYAKNCIAPRPQGIQIGFVSKKVHLELLKYLLHIMHKSSKDIRQKNACVSCRV